ncbi:MAG TPA: beta-ketoacyl reductase [Povalibacter sp.]
MPDRAAWTSVSPEHEAYERVKTVLELERQGAAVTVVSVDVSDRARMEELFATLREQTPALAGIIHAAADIKFSALTEMSAEALQATLRPKVQGTWLLHELSRNLPLDFFALFSSATTLFGASRIAHYAASNQALDFLAHWRRSAGLPALSVDWGAWEEIRLLGEHRDEVERFGLRPMPADRALQAMSRLAASRVAQRTVADVDWPLLKQAFETRGRHRFFERIASQASPAAAAVAESPVSWKALLETSAPEDRNEVLAGLVADEVRRVLELDSREPLDPDRGLFEMGMDSLMSVQLKKRLAHATGATLPATLTFTYPTVTALTQYLLREIFGVTPLAQAVPKTQPHIKTSPSLSPVTAADDLQALSDEQVKDLLSHELDSLSADLRE